MAAQFQAFEDAGNGFRWRLLADNNKIVAASSEAYRNKTNCLNGIEVCREGAAEATTYRGNKKEWRWRTVHPNGRIIATSGEGYKEKSDCEHGLQIFQRLAPTTPTVEVATVR